MPRPSRALPALFAAALVLTAAACGGDDDEPSTTSSTEATTTTTEATTSTDDATTTTEDGGAEDAPGETGHADEGLGDPLVFVAVLAGDAEVPGPGDPDGEGRIEIMSSTPGEWCVDMVAEGLGSAVSDSHLHFGTPGMNGDVVVPIGEPTSTSDGTDTWDDVCVDVESSLVAEVVDAPDAFYANVHTASHPDGAIRGQLEASTVFDLTLS